MNKWDFGGSVRARYEVKDDFGIPGVPGSLDFRDHGADVDNDYFLERIRLRAGYTDKWWSALVEGQSSLAQSDQRFAYANIPAVPGTVQRKAMARRRTSSICTRPIVTVGNHKEFPLSAKIGRQEMAYGDERLIGAFGWNNIGRMFDAAKVRWQNEWFGVDFFTGRPVIPAGRRVRCGQRLRLVLRLLCQQHQDSQAQPRLLFPRAQRQRRGRGRRAQPAVSAAERAGHLHRRRPDQVRPGRTRQLGLHRWISSASSATSTTRVRARRRPRWTRWPTRSSRRAVTPSRTPGARRASASNTPTVRATGIHSTTKHETFDNLFPTNHKFYGYMDFFSLQNIQDVRADLSDQADSAPERGGRRARLLAGGHQRQFLQRRRRGPRRRQPDARRQRLRRQPQLRQLRRHRTRRRRRLRPDPLSRRSKSATATSSSAITSKAVLSSPAFGATDANFFYAQLNVNF